MTPMPADRLAESARRAAESLATLGVGIEKAAAGLRFVAPHQPPPGPLRRFLDRINLWSGEVCARPGCDRPRCRQARARRDHSRER